MQVQKYYGEGKWEGMSLYVCLYFSKMKLERKEINPAGKVVPSLLASAWNHREDNKPKGLLVS